MARTMYSILDKKAKTWASPFIAENDVVMIRDLEWRLSRAEDSQIRKYPEDFCVDQVGSFDFMTGKVTACDLRRVIELTEIVRELERDDSQLPAERV